jgi:hypothetical protein
LPLGTLFERRRTVLLFAVVDKTFMGRGAFGVFSLYEKAQDFARVFENEAGHHCEIRSMEVIGNYNLPSPVFAAYTYDQLHDLQILDALCSSLLYASDIAEAQGLVMEFTVDDPEKTRIVEDP